MPLRIYYIFFCKFHPVGWLFAFYGISTLVGYSMPNPFYTNNQFYFKQFSSQFNCQKHFKQFSSVKQL